MKKKGGYTFQCFKEEGMIQLEIARPGGEVLCFFMSKEEGYDLCRLLLGVVWTLY